MSAIKKLQISNEVLLNLKKNYSKEQDQTKDIFGFKWSKRDTYESEAVNQNARRWLLERYCNNDPNLLKQWLNEGDTRKIIMDAGCGAGYSALILFDDLLNEHDYLGIDISDSIQVAEERFKEIGIEADFIKSSILDLPFIPDESIDVIFSEGVLHHTDNPELAFKYLTKKIKKGGRFLFYVYAKKAVIREYTDDFIRKQIEPLSNKDAWEKLKPLTELGIELGKLKTTINVPENIDFLNIKKGVYDIQRFFYWNICKLYYRPDYSLEEMNHINFDWFRPLNCHRFTPEEIKQWCEDVNLEMENFNVQESGITVVSKKQ